MAILSTSPILDVGTKTVPNDVRNVRQSSFDSHRIYGQPVIFKHKWNLRDIQNGLARYCPYDLDIAYGQARQWDPYCFGTGILGGFADGIITFITINDAPTDVFKIGPQGVLTYERHPGFTAPWTPEMGDGDLIIKGDFDERTWTMTTFGDRYELREVTPVTLRGFGERAQHQEFKINQQGEIDYLTLEHQFYQVPIKFDYDHLPPFPVKPPGGDPDDYPTGLFTSFSTGVRIAGVTGPLTSDERIIKINTVGIPTSSVQSIKIKGKANGVHIDF